MGDKCTQELHKAELASPEHLAQFYTAWPSHCQAVQEQFEGGEWSNSVEVFVICIGTKGCGCAGNLLPLMAESSAEHQLLAYAPNNNARLPGRQQQTMKSLNKYSFTIFGVYSFYTVAAERLAWWLSSWLCSWSRASDSKELRLSVQRSQRDTGKQILMPR